MAQELLRAGEQVDVVVLLDTMLPGARRRNWGRWAVEKLVRVGRGGVSGLLGRAGDLLGRRPRAGGEAAIPDANPVDAEARRLADIREAIYGEAMNRYRASPYPGTVLLARAQDKSFYASDIADETYGWGSLVASLGTCDVPGDHIGILTEPHVAILAEQLLRYLRGPGTSGETSRRPPSAP
jgi:thioesterase domain-containing protein